MIETDDPPQISNYVVDLCKGRIVTVIQGCHSYPGESQHHFDVIWLRGGRFVVVSHGAIWDMRGVYGVALSSDGKVAQIDLQKLISRDTRRHIDQTTDRGYRKYGAGVSVMPTDFKLTDRDMLRIKAFAYVPKDSPWTYDAQLIYRLRIRGTHCTATLRSIHGKAHIKYDSYNSGQPKL